MSNEFAYEVKSCSKWLILAPLDLYKLSQLLYRTEASTPAVNHIQASHQVAELASL